MKAIRPNSQVNDDAIRMAVLIDVGSAGISMPSGGHVYPCRMRLWPYCRKKEPKSASSETRKMTSPTMPGFIPVL